MIGGTPAWKASTVRIRLCRIIRSTQEGPQAIRRHAPLARVSLYGGITNSVLERGRKSSIPARWEGTAPVPHPRLRGKSGVEQLRCRPSAGNSNNEKRIVVVLLSDGQQSGSGRLMVTWTSRRLFVQAVGSCALCGVKPAHGDRH